MKITFGSIVVEITENEAFDITEGMGDTLQQTLIQEITNDIRGSEAWRDLRSSVFHACVNEIREQIRKDFKIQEEGKGE